MILEIQNDSTLDIPEYSDSGSSGFDFRANINRSLVIPPGKRAIIPTGVHISIPQGYEIQVRSRSGLAIKQGVFVLNSPGTVDSSFKDEICVILFNLGEENFEIKKGDRIAQGVLCKIEQASFKIVDKISREGDRGGGFGHSGI